MALSSKESPTFKGEKEKAPVVEIVVSPEVETSEYVKEINKEVSLKEPILDGVGEIVMDDANPNIEVVLPLTEEEMNKALHLKVIYSFRWLAEWAKRLLKITNGRIVCHFMQEQGV